jgi:hypothetical protein
MCRSPRAAALALFPALLSACSDYGFHGDKDPGAGAEDQDTGPEPVTPVEGAPEVQVSPERLALGPSCTGAQSAEVVVENVGDAPLTVQALRVEGEAWALDAPPALPLTLAAGGALTLRVVGGPGDAALIVESDDADEALIRVPMSAPVDLPPTVTLLSPTSGQILAVDAVGGLIAQVNDDHTAPTDLVVRWESDVDGVLSGGTVDAAGTATQPWDAALQTPGPHTFTVTVTDACEQTATATVSACQNAGYVSENLDLTSWTFNGTAGWDALNGWVELTAPYTDQAGTAFQTSAAVSSDNISVDFGFYVSGGTGADGMSVTALDTGRATSFVGNTGGGIGYGGLPGWSIEVDTWYNSEHADPTELDHLSLHLDGNVNGPVAWATLPEMEDGAWHQMSVRVIGARFTISVDGVVYIDQDVPGLSTFPAYIGFTAATGSVTNYHLIDALLVEELVCGEG